MSGACCGATRMPGSVVADVPRIACGRARAIVTIMVASNVEPMQHEIKWGEAGLGTAANDIPAVCPSAEYVNSI